MLDFFKKMLFFLLAVLVVFFIILGISPVSRDYLFTRIIHSYNFYQVMSMRQLVRNRDFLSAEKKLRGQVELSKKISTNRSQILTGIEESLDFVTSKIIFYDQFKKFKYISEELIKIDPNWYKPHILLAESIGNTDLNTALGHIDKAIDIVESNEGAYRSAIRIAGYGRNFRIAKKYCHKYSEAIFGGTTLRTHDGIFKEKGFNKLAISFNGNNSNTVFVNNGVILNEFREYEFIPKKPLVSNSISLFTGFPSGVRIELSKIKIKTPDSMHIILPSEIALTSKSSYINENNNNYIELITVGSDDRIDILLPGKISKIQKIIFKLKFSKLMLASKKICDSSD